MLSDFLVRNRVSIIERARVRVASRQVPLASPVELSEGVPLFLSQLTRLLNDEQRVPRPDPATENDRAHQALGGDADLAGDEMLRKGLTVAQVVEGYGDVCQAITEQAIDDEVELGSDEYRTLNLCLDVATARAVTAFSRERDRTISRQSTERLGMLAHELRNLLSTAMLSFDALRRGNVGVESRTGELLGRSLQGLRALVDRSLAEVRLAAKLVHPTRVDVARLVEEIEVGAALDAKGHQVELSVATVEGGLAIHADHALVASAVANVVQNAIKFTRRGGRVSLSARAAAGQVLIDVADQCGGLPDGAAAALFSPFERAGAEQVGLGLGLKISLDAVRANGGSIRARDVPGEGCVFTIEFPAAAAAS